MMGYMKTNAPFPWYFLWKTTFAKRVRVFVSMRRFFVVVWVLRSKQVVFMVLTFGPAYYYTTISVYLAQY